MMPESRHSPWSRSDHVAAAAIGSVGVALWCLAWFAVAGERALGRQVGWISTGTIAVAMVFAGEAVWLRRGRAAVAQRLRRALDVRLVGSLAPVDAPVMSPQRSLVAGEGLHLYHLADCPIAEGRAWALSSKAVHEAGGRVPCRICLS